MNNKDLIKKLDKAIESFEGDATELEKAIGMLVVGRKFGWKVLMLIHDKRTIKKYEKFLDVNLREELPEVGKLASHSVAWKIVEKVGGFWNAVKGTKSGIRTPKLEV